MKRDISWAKLNKYSNPEFKEGVRRFMQFTEPLGERMHCPCRKCCNGCEFKRRKVERHIFQNGFCLGYNIWHHHGDVVDYTNPDGQSSLLDHRGRLISDVRNTGLRDMIDELHTGMQDEVTGEAGEDNNTGDTEPLNSLIDDANVPLFEGASISKLDYLIRLFHLKVENHWTNKSFDQALALQKMVNPTADIPKDYAEAKKIIAKLGFSYEKVHACPNDCMLYFGEDKDLEICKTCQTGRYVDRQLAQRSEASSSRASNFKKKQSRVPQKVVRYFPVKKRLERLFASSKTAENMTWHADGRNNDGHLRHPADGEEWKRIDNIYPDFAAEPRNVRLGLSADGFEPFKSGESHSLWPVTLVVYNLPPWMCMKPSYT